ncbi:MAG: hypothetical protein K2X27_02700, partial [Candidatus Obscuribacterales bacterium]|nr:hypothetical protein [Candidatus Obscuribacterales bacterium]
VKDAGLAGVNFDASNVDVAIIGTPIKTTVQPLRSADKLAVVNTKDYLYQIEVTVNGTVEPLVTLSDSIFGKVPGLTIPMPITASYRQFSEHPQGLAQ